MITSLSTKSNIPEVRFIFGRNVKKARQALSLTQKELGEKIGRDQGFVSCVERGYKSSLHLDDVEIISRALKIPLKKLIS